MCRRLVFSLGASLLIIWGPASALGQGQQAAPGEIEVAPLPAANDASDPQPITPIEAESPDERAGAPDGRAPKRDEAVDRVQASPAQPPAAAAPEPGAEAAHGSFLQPLDRLQMGKHEVLLSVQVVAPQDMNINKEAMVKVVVRNSGSADALGVVVRDELPPGLQYVSSSPEAQKSGDSLLTWNLGILQAGTDRAMLVRVKPTQPTPMDHAATVTFQAGSRARSRVLQPKLRVEVVQSPSIEKVLKGQTSEFRISVTNTGDGPARDVVVLATLGSGLSHESGEKNEDNSFDLPIREILPGRREDLPPMIVDAKQGGRQSFKVKATSPDVEFNKDEAEIEKFVDVIEPKLEITLDAPEKRYTDTIATYALKVKNSGTAPARNVRLLVSLPVSGKLVSKPPGASFDAAHKLTWTIPLLDPSESPKVFPFEVRMGGVGFYEVTAEGKADNLVFAQDKRTTDVQGMADLEVVVRERRRVVDVDGTTSFQVRLRNYGSKEAANVAISAEVSPNLVIEETAGGPEANFADKNDRTKAVFTPIARLDKNKELIFQIKVKVVNHDNKPGVCRIFVKHDDQTEALEDMAMVKIAEGRRTANAKETPNAK
jgi:uncharacterized repeat protein (TIGR01451 family)